MKATTILEGRRRGGSETRPYMAYGLAVLLVLALGVAAAVHAQSGGYDLTWNTVDNGGVTFRSGGGYELGGSIGQPDAAVWSGGGFTLTGGFWSAALAGAAPGGGKFYLPVIFKNWR
jgi:hypothetical protein